MTHWLLRMWRKLHGRPSIETAGLDMLDLLHETRRAALAETRRLRRADTRADIAEVIMDARHRGDG